MSLQFQNLPSFLDSSHELKKKKKQQKSGHQGILNLVVK